MELRIKARKQFLQPGRAMRGGLSVGVESEELNYALAAVIDGISAGLRYRLDLSRLEQPVPVIAWR